jgi:hypothetical protein
MYTAYLYCVCSSGHLSPPVLAVNDVSFAYSGKKEDYLYRHLELSVDLDSRIAVIGPNGGKKRERRNYMPAQPFMHMLCVCSSSPYVKTDFLFICVSILGGMHTCIHYTLICMNAKRKAAFCYR